MTDVLVTIIVPNDVLTTAVSVVHAFGEIDMFSRRCLGAGGVATHRIAHGKIDPDFELFKLPDAASRARAVAAGATISAQQAQQHHSIARRTRQQKRPPPPE